MKNKYFIFLKISVFFLLLFYTGCEPFDDNDSPSGIIDIGGKWHGKYYEKEGASKKNIVELEAFVTIDYTNVTILTTKEGRAHYLIGHVDSYGNMFMKDQYDEEIWTTHFTPATPNLIILNDWLILHYSMAYLELTR